MPFAKDTSVPVGRSQDEIKRTLEKYGATGFMYGESAGQAMVCFEMKQKRVKFMIATPVYGQAMVGKYTKMSQEKCAQRARTAWRCLLLAIKAKLECAESGISTFEKEFLAHIVMPNGQTVGEVLVPQLDDSYTTKQMPPLLAGRIGD